MEKIKDKLQADLKTAMLERNEEKKSIIRVMIGELNRLRKDISDEEFEQQSISTIKKMYQNAIDLNNPSEVNIVSIYLPKMIETDELEEIIRDIIKENGYSSVKEMGLLMSNLKTTYNGQYDGKKASEIIKKLLN